MTRLILASASPARLKTLRAAGVEPEVLVSGVDESTVEESRPETLCLVLARLKAEAVAAMVGAPALVLGCDSVLAFDGEVYGRPADLADARARWQRMRGRSGVLHTGHCLVDTGTGKVAAEAAATIVHFADITDAEMEAYLGTGEPLRVAGAFTIDGLGGWFLERIEGDAGNVVGVSLPLLRRLLAEHGTSVVDLWTARTGDPLASDP